MEWFRVNGGVEKSECAPLMRVNTDEIYRHKHIERETEGELMAYELND